MDIKTVSDAQNQSGTQPIPISPTKAKSPPNMNNKVPIQQPPLYLSDCSNGNGDVKKCIFIKMFHCRRTNSDEEPEEVQTVTRSKLKRSNTRRASSLSPEFRTSLKLFAMMYMRNWNQLISCSGNERILIQQFKLQHSRIHKDEWNAVSSFINLSMVDTASKSSAFKQFSSLINAYFASLPFLPTGKIERVGLLHQSLLEAVRTDRERFTDITPLEILSLYICIYYPNFEEIWESDVLILHKPLIQQIEVFTKENPVIDAEIAKAVADCIEDSIGASVCQA
jgi:hypothetical protein